MSRTILAEVNGWIPLIDHLVHKYDVTTAAVFGRAWRYCQMWNGVCKASLPTIAADLGLARGTVRTAIKRLVDDGYLEDVTPNLVGRVHIYRDTGKVTIMAKFEAQVQDDQQPEQPLQNLEGLKNGGEKPLQNLEGPLQILEGYPSNGCTEPLQNFATNHKSLLIESVNQSLESPKNSFQERPAKAWLAVMAQLKSDLPRAAYDTNVAQTEYLSYANGTFVIQTPTGYIRDWMTSRVSSTAIRLLTGMMAQTVDVVFVERGNEL